MTQKKEPHFFNSPDWLERRDWYESLFVDAPIRGESSPNYTAFPLTPPVPERVRSLIPDAKLIYLVGDPVKRSGVPSAARCGASSRARSSDPISTHPPCPA